LLTDISYKNYQKRSDIHGTVLYPATMIAPVQKDLLTDILAENKIESIFDPFYGSGTALYEASELNGKIHLIGCDINPLAYLITKTKLHGVSESIYYDISSLELTIKTKEPDNYYFPNMEKWFREDIADDLRRIRLSIMEIDDVDNRLYCWCMFTNIVRKYSNTRSSTYKLHIKQAEKIKQMCNNAIDDFCSMIWKNIDMYQHSSHNFELYKCDTLEKIRTFSNNAFDLSITSPPYGDNETTVPYGQFSSLALQWINSDDLYLDGWELRNYSIIDSNSMGGRDKHSDMDIFCHTLLSPFLNNISESKQQKVINFFNDYFDFLRQLCRVTNQYIILTLGNRTVDNINIDLTNISRLFLENLGFKNLQTISREIPVKRIPRVTSSVDNESVSSMNSEYVIIHKRM